MHFVLYNYMHSTIYDKNWRNNLEWGAKKKKKN